MAVCVFKLIAHAGGYIKPRKRRPDCQQCPVCISLVSVLSGVSSMYFALSVLEYCAFQFSEVEGEVNIDPSDDLHMGVVFPPQLPCN